MPRSTISSPRPLTSRESRLRIGLSWVFSTVFVLAAIWAVVVTLKGRFVADLHVFRISSRSPRNAIIIAVLGAVAVWMATPARRRQDVIAEWRRIGPACFVTA